ncbi:cob(I)yrinic acid a,c-diamide adenosyltransferase [Erysipelotrichaceae bacterium OttesenSCG-928-M19]|nr:cob(I)yrinic acid a,c-diamide adenosyltransferase [Erysipelotrichaceae bacterium OttesenSCG-928-M19]
MKVYTKTGDKQTTGVIGDRISKSSLRIDCYGTTDEALAHIGLAFYYLKDEVIIEQVTHIMKLFFLIGQDLANPKQTIPYAITNEDALKIEEYIDYIEEENEPLTSFIYPAGHPASCEANIARTIIRRAERKIVTLSLKEDINKNILPLVNRLSDYFYVLSRYLNKENNYQEMKMEFK